MAIASYRVALTLLRQMLGECDASCGRLVIVEGGVASGKTSLTRQFSRQVTDSGALLLNATGSRAEREVPLGVVDQLFAATASLTVPEGVSQQLAIAGKRNVNEGGQGRDTQARPQVYWERELCARLLELSKERPVVVLVDDIQFVDDESLRFLLSLARRTVSARILLVINQWHRPRMTQPAFSAELTRLPHVSIRLAPLTVEDTADVLSRAPGGPVDQNAAARLHDLTNGNPMLVAALLEDGLSEPAEPVGEAPHTPVVGVAYAHAVLAILHRWDAPLLAIARAVAVLGERATPALAGRLLGMRAQAAEEVVGILSDAGVLRCCRMRHPVGAATVLDSMSQAERSELHLRAADLLHQQGDPALDVARHLLAAEQVPGPWAVGVLRDAADRIGSTDGERTAERCLMLALSGASDREERLAITLALVRALGSRDPSAAGRYLPALLAAIDDGDLTGHDAALVVRYALWNGDEVGAGRAAKAVLAGPGPVDPQVAAELAVSFHWVFGPSRARQHEVSAAGANHKDMWTEATHRLSAMWSRGAGDANITSAEHILRSCQVGETPLDLVAAALCTTVRGNRPELAKSWCERLMRQAEGAGRATWTAVLGAVAAWIALRHGDPAGSIRRAEKALSLLPVRGWGVLIGIPMSILIMARTVLGDYDQADELLRSRVPDAMYTTTFGPIYLQARGQHFLATGRVLAAARDFEMCGKLMQQWEVDVPALVTWRCDLAEANVLVGRTSEARELLKQQLGRVPTNDLRTRGIALRVLAAASEAAQRPALLRKSVECLQSADDRLELSKALTAYGLVREQRGEYDRALSLARRAQVASGAPAPPVPRGHELTPQPRALTGQPRPLERDGQPVLSEAEQRVARLAALGHTNREISQTLYITVSTVEQHLTRVYRKLGISRRADLSGEDDLRQRLVDLNPSGSSPAGPPGTATMLSSCSDRAS